MKAFIVLLIFNMLLSSLNGTKAVATVVLGEVDTHETEPINAPRVIFVNVPTHKYGLGNLLYVLAAAVQYNKSHEVIIKAHAGALFPDYEVMGFSRDQVQQLLLNCVPYSRSILRNFHFEKDIEGSADLPKFDALPW